MSVVNYSSSLKETKVDTEAILQRLAVLADLFDRESTEHFPSHIQLSNWAREMRSLVMRLRKDLRS